MMNVIISFFMLFLPYLYIFPLDLNFNSVSVLDWCLLIIISFCFLFLLEFNKKKQK